MKTPMILLWSETQCFIDHSAHFLKRPNTWCERYLEGNTYQYQ